MIKRLSVLLAILGVILSGLAIPSAWATVLPPGCVYYGGPGDTMAATPGLQPDTGDIHYIGMAITPPCNPAGHFRITINFWTEIAGKWINPMSKSLYLRTGATIIPAGVLTFPCTHLAPIQGRIMYVAGTTMALNWTTPGNCS